MGLKPERFEHDALVAIRAHQDAANVGGLAEVLASDVAARSALVRFSAARALARLADERAVDTLLPLLADDHETVRQAAAEALGRTRSERALPGLVEALHDPSRYVRGAAAAALGLIGGEQARRALERAWRDDPARNVRATARRSLKGFGRHARTAPGWPWRR